MEQHEFEYDGAMLKVTASLGVFYCDGTEDIGHAEVLVDRADKQLYRAKESGRNQVCY